jgi:hypothetical protein
MTTPHRRASKALWFNDFSGKRRGEPSVMTCPECGSHPHAPAAFCTHCGTDLLAARETCEPLSVGSWTPDSAQLSDRTTEPILGVRRQPPPPSAPVHPASQPNAHSSTPVKEMVGSERAEWIDRVWCSAAGVSR